MKENELNKIEAKEKVETSDNDILFIDVWDQTYAIGEFEDGMPFEQKISGYTSTRRNGEDQMTPQYEPGNGKFYKVSMGEVKWRVSSMTLDGKHAVFIMPMNEVMQAVLHPRYIYVETGPRVSEKHRG